MLSEPEIMSLISFSALLLIYMMTFLKPEKNDEEDTDSSQLMPKKVKIDPYLPFMSPTMNSPYYYTAPSEGNKISLFHLDA
jgi:hypothetical protein